MREYQVPYWATIIIANMEINAGQMLWASIWLTAALVILILDFKYGKV